MCDGPHIIVCTPSATVPNMSSNPGNQARGTMKQVQAAVDRFRAESVSELSDKQLVEGLVELQRLADLMEIERMRLHAEIEGQGRYSGKDPP